MKSYEIQEKVANMNILLEIIVITLLTFICTAILTIVFLYIGWWLLPLSLLIIVISCLLVNGNRMDKEYIS